MFSATSLRPFGASTLRSTVFLERRFRAHLAVRDRLLFDSTYLPPVKKPTSFAHLYVQLRGAWCGRCSSARAPRSPSGPHWRCEPATGSSTYER